MAAARASAVRDHPGAKITRSDIRAVEADSIIVAVFHDGGRPVPRWYYRVRRGDLRVTEESQANWWPRGLK